MQEDHEVDTWVLNAMFSACAAYSSPELRIVMIEAYKFLEDYREEIMAQRRVPARNLM